MHSCEPVILALCRKKPEPMGAHFVKKLSFDEIAKFSPEIFTFPHLYPGSGSVYHNDSIGYNEASPANGTRGGTPWHYTFWTKPTAASAAKAHVPAGLPHPHQHPRGHPSAQGKRGWMPQAGCCLRTTPDHGLLSGLQPREPVRGALHPQPDAQPRSCPLFHHRGLYLHHLCQQDDPGPCPQKRHESRRGGRRPCLNLTIAVLLALGLRYHHL